MDFDKKKKKQNNTFEVTITSWAEFLSVDIFFFFKSDVWLQKNTKYKRCIYCHLARGYRISALSHGWGVDDPVASSAPGYGLDQRLHS